MGTRTNGMFFHAASLEVLLRVTVRPRLIEEFIQQATLTIVTVLSCRLIFLMPSRSLCLLVLLARNFAHRNFVAFEIFAFAATDIIRFLTCVTSWTVLAPRVLLLRREYHWRPILGMKLESLTAGRALWQHCVGHRDAADSTKVDHPSAGSTDSGASCVSRARGRRLLLRLS